MAALFNPSPLVLSTLQNLSLVLERSTALSRGLGVAGLAVGRSEARAFGGLDMNIQRAGQAMAAKVRYGAITVAPRAQGSAFSNSPGVHPAIDRAYDNPGVRFGDRVRGGERPISAAGETSCHFSQTSVSKTSLIREMIRAVRGGRRITGSRAAAHVLYVEREGAPEQIKKRGEERLQGEAFTAEIERRGLDRSAVAQQAYIERAGAAEGIERKPGRAIPDDELDALDEASFGTIGDTVEERTRFWLAVEEAEATPKGDRITIKPGDNPKWWAQVSQAVQSAPSAAQKPIRDALACDDGEPFDLTLTTEKAFAFHQWAVGLDTEAPLEISPGRGGRTQTRVIAELPHELDGRERLQIVRDFTQKLAEKGFPYWAVIHAPDANNDARNYHVHVAYYDRPAAKITNASGNEVWDFEILEEVTWKNRTKHLIRTHQQNRLRETNNRDWVTELRKHWETVSNRALEDAGVSKRYNLGTYGSMGIDLEPLKHINSRTFNKERKGELTEEGPVLARRQWDNVHDRMVKEHEARARRRQISIEAMGDHAVRLVARQAYGAHRVAEVQRLKGLGAKASFQLALAELHQDLTRLVTDRVASRPKLIMTAADKDEEKARKKKGLPLDAPPEDRPIAGASLFGMSHRSQIAGYLTALYDGALTLDRDNGRRTQAAQHNVRLIVQELKAWIAAPGRPLNTVKRYSDEPLQALDDPKRIARQEAMKAALEDGFRQAAERDAPQILDAIRRAVDQPTTAQDRPKTSDRASGSGPTDRPARPPQSHREPASRTSETAGAEPSRTPYKPGRPEGETPKADRRGFRARPTNPLLEANLVGQARSRGAPSQREMVQIPPSREPAAGRPTAEPSPSSRETIAREESAAHRRDQVTNPTSPQASPAPTDAGRACLATTDGAHAETQASSPPNPNAGMVRATQAGTEARETEAAPVPSQARDPRPMSSLQVRAARASATPPQPGPAATRPKTPVDTPARHVQSAEPVAAPTPAPPTGTPVRNSNDSRSADPAPLPSDTCTAAAPATPPTVAGARPTAQRGTGQQSERTSAGPDIAAIMDARDRAVLSVPKPPVEPDKHPTQQKSTEPQPEIRIIGAKRPAKRRVSRDRGRER